MSLFTKAEIEIFDIPDFAGRMAAIREGIRPVLTRLGDELKPVLSKRFGQEFHPHVAKHLRRKVNPPDETWVAWGPEARGYKAYVFFSLCVGKRGVQARVVMKDECPLRPDLGKNLLKNEAYFLRQEKSLQGLRDYSKGPGVEAAKLSSLGDALEAIGQRLQQVKSATFDVGLPVDYAKRDARDRVVKAFEALLPFYQCGLHRKINLG